jgi:hypothetical protein
MTSYTRRIAEAPLYIGQNEEIPYTLTFSGFVPAAVTTLATPVCTLHDVTAGEPGVSVGATKLSGSPTFSGVVMTLPLIIDLVREHKYLLRCRGTGGGGTYELWGEVFGEL